MQKYPTTNRILKKINSNYLIFPTFSYTTIRVIITLSIYRFFFLAKDSMVALYYIIKLI